MDTMELEVRRIVKLKYPSGFRSDRHDHDFYHFIYVLDGTGMIEIDNVEFVAQQDELFPIVPHKFHMISSCGTRLFRTIEVKFKVGDPKIVEEIKKFPYGMKITDKTIRYLLECMIMEASGEKPYYKYLIHVKFANILLNLMRSLNCNCSTEQSELYEEDDEENMNNVRRYIEKNVGSSLGLDELANVAKMSKAYFCKVFKSKFGISPNQYVNKVKLAKAKELMMQSDLNITQISDFLGFSSIHYFSKFFKKRENVPPVNFIDRLKSDIRIDIENCVL